MSAVIVLAIIAIAVAAGAVGVYAVASLRRSSSSESTNAGQTTSPSATATSSAVTIPTIGQTTGVPILEFQALVTSTDSQYGYFSWNDVSTEGSELLLGTPANSSLPIGLDVYLTMSDQTIHHEVFSTIGKVVDESHTQASYNYSIAVQNASLPSRIPTSWGTSAGNDIVLTVFKYSGATLTAITDMYVTNLPGPSNPYRPANILDIVGCGKSSQTGETVYPCLLPSEGKIEVTGSISIWDSLPQLPNGSYIPPFYTSMSATIESVAASAPFSVLSESPNLPVSASLWGQAEDFITIPSSIAMNITITSPQGDYLGPLILNMNGTYPLSLVGTSAPGPNTRYSPEVNLIDSAAGGSQLTLTCGPLSPATGLLEGLPVNALGVAIAFENYNYEGGGPNLNLTSISLTYGGGTYSSPVVGLCSLASWPNSPGLVLNLNAAAYLVFITALPGSTSYAEPFTGLFTFSNGSTVPFNGIFE